MYIRKVWRSILFYWLLNCVPVKTLLGPRFSLSVLWKSCDTTASPTMLPLCEHHSTNFSGLNPRTKRRLAQRKTFYSALILQMVSYFSISRKYKEVTIQRLVCSNMYMSCVNWNVGCVRILTRSLWRRYDMWYIKSSNWIKYLGRTLYRIRKYTRIFRKMCEGRQSIRAIC